MIDIFPSKQNNRFEQWLEELSRVQYAFVMGTSLIVMWILIWIFFGEEPLRISIRAGGLAALVFGGIHYLLDPR